LSFDFKFRIGNFYIQKLQKIIFSKSRKNDYENNE